MAAFTGIEFDHVTNLLLPVSSPLTRRYTFRGRVHGLAFQITVDVRDDSFEILHLRPALSPDLTVALADFLEACVLITLSLRYATLSDELLHHQGAEGASAAHVLQGLL